MQCKEAGIGQKFTRVKRSETNGKAERVIRTLMEMWHRKEEFKDLRQRQISLLRFINFWGWLRLRGVLVYENAYKSL